MIILLDVWEIIASFCYECSHILNLSKEINKVCKERLLKSRKISAGYYQFEEYIIYTKLIVADYNLVCPFKLLLTFATHCNKEKPIRKILQKNNNDVFLSDLIYFARFNNFNNQNKQFEILRRYYIRDRYNTVDMEISNCENYLLKNLPIIYIFNEIRTWKPKNKIDTKLVDIVCDNFAHMFTENINILTDQSSYLKFSTICEILNKLDYREPHYYLFKCPFKILIKLLKTLQINQYPENILCHGNITSKNIILLNNQYPEIVKLIKENTTIYIKNTESDLQCLPEIRKMKITKIKIIND